MEQVEDVVPFVAFPGDVGLEIEQGLLDMRDTFGANRQIALARELTKIHEEVVRTTLSRALELYREKAPRGEFVLVVEGASQQQEQLSFEQALELVRALVDKGEPLSKAAKDVAHQTGFKKGELYSRFLGQ